MGKTTCMVNLALNMLLKNNLKVGIFSLEMPDLSIAEKMLFTHAQVNAKEIKKGNIHGIDFQTIYACAKELESKISIIEDSAKIGISDLFNRVHHWIETVEIDIVFIDYLQLISSSNDRSKYEQITEISQQLKILAKDANIPIVCLAQLNRNAARDVDTKPRISDLRDSGSIEQDADEIFLLHCPSLENPHEKPGLLEVVIGKNRFGETGKIELCFQKSTGFIGDLSKLKRPDEEEDKIFG